MTPLARKTLRTYAEGMAMPYREVVRVYQRLDQTGKGRALVQMRALEQAWQAEQETQAEPRWWARAWRRWLATLKRWRTA